MFDHLGLPVTDLEHARRFYEQALQPLGIAVVKGFPDAVGLAAGQGRKGEQELWLTRTGHAPSPLHIAFAATTRAQVDAFHRAALAAGGRDNGAPGLRPQYHDGYYGAFVIGPDGHNLEAVCHLPPENTP
ncbi:VOC family protein [Frateuria sp. MAH-13]|uniref:VOC family protein n=1 Tax=Frateuria flava TaxID=2821489 RepID=A0ABS4DPG6_9GAMM|nr:VOC family protein [Frateuria flava]MBP1474954.1 VOC family protein [Frateuria flava]